MATFSNSLRHVKAHLDQLLPRQDTADLCRELGHQWRKRVLDPALTVHLFLLQLLAQVALEGLRHAASIQVTAQALCKARQRLPLKLMMELVARSAGSAPSHAQEQAQSLWNGLMIYLADGTTFLTPDTPDLARHYGKSKNQRGTSLGYPSLKLLALMDLSGGLIRRVIALPSHRQEFTCLSRLFVAIVRNCGDSARALLLGDRGLVSFVHLFLMIQAGIQGCFRLPRGQVAHHRGRLSRRLVKRLGRQDLLVRWTATCRPKWLSKKSWKPLAARQLVLRQIAFRILRKGFRTQWAWIITTLTDPRKYPAEEVAQLYGKRWQIEVCFRDLKSTLNTRMLRSKSIAGVRKEILAFVLLYNLIRRVMQQAATLQQVAVQRISFIDATRWLLWSSPGQAFPTLKVNPVRIRCSPPRRLKNARHRYPQLNAPRNDLDKPPYQIKL